MGSRKTREELVLIRKTFKRFMCMIILKNDYRMLYGLLSFFCVSIVFEDKFCYDEWRGERLSC